MDSAMIMERMYYIYKSRILERRIELRSLKKNSILTVKIVYCRDAILYCLKASFLGIIYD